MEQSRKNLKISSIVVLVFAGLSLLNLVFELLFGEINRAEIPAGSPNNILLITKIILAVVTIVLLLPQVYIGIKGLKVAKNPDASKGHIIWGTILFVLSIVGMVSPVINIVTQNNIGENVSTLLSILVETLVYFEYIKYAKAVAKAI